MTNSKAKPDREPALKVVMQPNQMNVHNTIFGGTILSYIDLAGAVHCRAAGCERCVTVAMERVEFQHPVYAGDVVSFYGRTTRIGRTSITVQISLWADRFDRPAYESEWVTEAEVTYVNIDPETRKPTPVPK